MAAPSRKPAPSVRTLEPFRTEGEILQPRGRGQGGYALVQRWRASPCSRRWRWRCWIRRMGLADAGAEQAADAGGWPPPMRTVLRSSASGSWAMIPRAALAADGAVLALRFGEAELRIARAGRARRARRSACSTTSRRRLGCSRTGWSEGERLLIARDSSWTGIDDDEIKRLRRRGSLLQRRRHSPAGARLASIDELALVRGLDPVIVRASGPMSPPTRCAAASTRNMRIRARSRAMEAGGDGLGPSNARARLAGERTALAFASTPSLVDRPVSIEVLATLPGGGRAAADLVAEITGISNGPRSCGAYE